MKISIITKEKKKEKTVILKDGMIFVHVSEEEALSIIHSLSSQICHRSPNTDRKESYTEDGTYFTIGVNEFKSDIIQKQRKILNDQAVGDVWAKINSGRL